MTIARIVSDVELQVFSQVEPMAEAGQASVALIVSSTGSLFGAPDCTPGHFITAGQGWDKQARHAQGHLGGAEGFFAPINTWRDSGAFEGVRFTR